ncbi:MAG: hypothetical protein J6M07_05005 [Ruminococcus sp.]|nr:hypothetical protein [Ruminococcus sp.]
MVRRAKRKVEGFSDPENIRKAKAELKAAQKKLRDFIDQTNAAEGKVILKRDKGREKIYGAPSPPVQSAPAPPVDVPDTPKVTPAEVTLDAPQAPPDAYRDTPVPERLFMSASDNSPLSQAQPTKHSDSEYAEIIRYAEEKGIHIHSVKEFDGDTSLLKDQIDAIADVRPEYEIKKKMTILFDDMPDDDLAVTSDGAERMSFTKKALRDRNITEMYLSEDNVLATNQAKGIAYHEMGHVLSYIYGEIGLDIAIKAYYNI